MGEKKCVLLVDVIGSRKYEDSQRLQYMLKQTIEYLNSVYADELQSEVQFEAGDSVQGLFCDGAAAFLYYRMMTLLLYPIRLRGAMGYGTIDYYDEHMRTNELNGEAYHFARQGMKDIYSIEPSIKCVYVSRQAADRDINMRLGAQQLLQDIQSDSAWLVSLITEVISPLQSANMNYQRNRGVLLEIIKGKKVICEDIPIALEPWWIDTKREENEEAKYHLVDDFTPRGLQNMIAEMIGMSRQGISRHFVKTVRNERKYAAAVAEALLEDIRR